MRTAQSAEKGLLVFVLQISMDQTPCRAERVLGAHVAQVMGAQLSSKDAFECKRPFLLWVSFLQDRHVGNDL